MEFIDFTKLLKRKKGTIFTLVFIIIVLTLGISLLNTLKYEAKSRLLVVQNTTGNDPYTISKSNEYLGNLFAQVVYSGSFYNLVLGSQYDVDKSYFSGTYNDQMKKWGNTNQTKTISDTGIIEINVYHPNPYQAQQIALAVNDVLINKNSNYQGNGQGIKVNIIDQPLISTYPVKPNLPQNLALALASGLLLSLFYIYLFPEERYNIRLWPTQKIKKIKNTGHTIKLDYYPLNTPDSSGNQINNQLNETFRPQGNINNVFRN
jgi:capsular polysaccharide biosynthesis protein